MHKNCWASPLEHMGHNYWNPCVLGPASCNYQRPHALETVLHNRSHCNEKPAHSNKGSSHWMQLEKACMQERYSTDKNKFLKNQSTMALLTTFLSGCICMIEKNTHTMVGYWQCFPTPCSVTLCSQCDCSLWWEYIHQENWKTLQITA